jgi:hypothetical protein
MEADMKKITVHVPEHLNLEQSHKVLVSVLGRVGHPTCFSGFNISFENAVDPADIHMSVEKGTQKVVGIG